MKSSLRLRIESMAKKQLKAEEKKQQEKNLIAKAIESQLTALLDQLKELDGKSASVDSVKYKLKLVQVGDTITMQLKKGNSVVDTWSARAIVDIVKGKPVKVQFEDGTLQHVLDDFARWALQFDIEWA